jgi:hypothetical protein
MRTGAVKSLRTDGSLDDVGICNIESRNIVPRIAACPFGTVASFGMKGIDAPDKMREERMALCLGRGAAGV